ncbi:hypothetical protein DSO57_1007529 [Entomophthora muscae]|uniref:Uncharacterized protein n=1 Tax=Entomophthora muscae TaxID=34485 RepID=A0ACC2USS6_9FUNG|nr:hypothetical protein DSO57_1007529 [Entomophthora muscae]
MHNAYGYVPKGSNDGMAWRAAVWATSYSMVALLGPKGVKLYQMILGSHNSWTFLSFLQLVQGHLRRTSWASPTYLCWTTLVSTRCVVIHMCAVLQARVDLASNKDNMLKNCNAWLVGNKGLPEAVVASTQQKMLAALGYSASPSRKPWLREGED